MFAGLPWFWPQTQAPFAPGPEVTTTVPPPPPTPPTNPWAATVTPTPDRTGSFAAPPGMTMPPAPPKLAEPPRTGMFASPQLGNPTYSTADLKINPMASRGLTSFAGMGKQQAPSIAMPPMPHDQFQSPGPRPDTWQDPSAIASAMKRLRLGGPEGTAPKLNETQRYDAGVFTGGQSKPRGATIHYTGGSSAAGAIDTLKKRGLSYNYLIDRNGEVIGLVPPDRQAAHMYPAGYRMKAPPQGAQGLSNKDTIGYSFVGRGEGDLTPAQKKTMQALISRDGQKFGFKPDQVFGHGEINGHKDAAEGSTVARLLRAQGFAIPTSAPDVVTTAGFSPGPEPQIMAQAERPQARPAPRRPVASASPSVASPVPVPPKSVVPKGVRSIMDPILNAIQGVTPKAAASPQAASEAKMLSDLDTLGITRDHPLRPMYETQVKALTAYPPRAEEWSPIRRGIATFADALGAGLRRRGGDSSAQMITPDIIRAQMKDGRASDMQAYQARLQLLQQIMPQQLADHKRQRDQAARAQILGRGEPGQGTPAPLPSIGGPNLAPGPSAAVQMPNASRPAIAGAPPAGPTAPVAPVQRQELPPPPAGTRMAGAPEIGLQPPPAPQDDAMPPAALPGLGQAPQPQAPQQPRSFATPGVAPQARSTPTGPAGPASKYGVDLEEINTRVPMPYSQRQIEAALITDPAMAKEMQDANEAASKERDRQVKWYETLRQDNPELVATKEKAKHDAKRDADLTTAQIDARRAGVGIVENLRSLKEFSDSKDWSDHAVGSWQTSDEPVFKWPPALSYVLPELPSPRQLSRLPTAMNNISNEEAVSRITQRAKALAAVTKPFVRKPGEGTWTDKDQEHLEQLVGDLTKAQDRGDFQRRLEQLRSTVEDTFAKPLGIKLDEIGDGKKKDGSTGGTGRRLKYNQETGEIE